MDTSNLGTAGSGADYASDDENAVIFARPIAPIPSTKDITDKLTIRLTQPGEDVDTVISLDPSTEDPVLVVAAQVRFFFCSHYSRCLWKFLKDEEQNLLRDFEPSGSSIY